ncbi:hypothetical protein PTSG_08186 [Salpingoeca rosetta]|uniref:VOC domain-containing protein n=1 Tax=Salpingoeca rosetta (strain ATCC 50818 / BSB-021) TaxID=946362 RepID=F2UI90_SALR5|nr:uncharacterized protein PTSG_08186 [Salpingoeca rosetta]EGD76839.1 hypothetical protein PTSG_08186 [Salpingoeca rosetta]|eukprot:XP_004991211.1 hypothetical protein PTSG_08186 [Salpingoeca rosetta]
MSEQEAKKAKTTQAMLEKSPKVTPEICVGNVDKAIELYKAAFGATVKFGPYRDDSGKCVHCAVKFANGAWIFLMDDYFDTESKAPESTAVKTMNLFLSFEEDKLYPAWKRALANGCTVVTELKKQHWGGHYGCLVDELGIRWSFSGLFEVDTLPESPDEEGAKEGTANDKANADKETKQ